MRKGNRECGYVVSVEFPSLEQAHRWWDSEEYRPLKALRQEHAGSPIIFGEGLPPG